MLDIDGAREQILLLRREQNLYCYINSCPHTGVNLDWMPDEFLDETGTKLQCSTHGALFQVEDGLCVWGPCAGQSLTSRQVSVKSGDVFLAE